MVKKWSHGLKWLIVVHNISITITFVYCLRMVSAFNKNVRYLMFSQHLLNYNVCFAMVVLRLYMV